MKKTGKSCWNIYRIITIYKCFTNLPNLIYWNCILLRDTNICNDTMVPEWEIKEKKKVEDWRSKVKRVFQIHKQCFISFTKRKTWSKSISSWVELLCVFFFFDLTVLGLVLAKHGLCHIYALVILLSMFSFTSNFLSKNVLLMKIVLNSLEVKKKSSSP